MLFISTNNDSRIDHFVLTDVDVDDDDSTVAVKTKSNGTKKFVSKQNNVFSSCSYSRTNQLNNKNIDTNNYCMSSSTITTCPLDATVQNVKESRLSLCEGILLVK